MLWKWRKKYSRAGAAPGKEEGEWRGWICTKTEAHAAENSKNGAGINELFPVNTAQPDTTALLNKRSASD